MDNGDIILQNEGTVPEGAAPEDDDCWPPEPPASFAFVAAADCNIGGGAHIRFKA